MGYTAPTTRTTGTLITASIWNTDLVDDIAYLYSLAEGSHNGWVKELDTWVYVSATSFKITGKDVTARFPKGTKLKCTDNSTTKYFSVVSSSFSTDTTVTITAGSDYSLAGGAITSPYYSYAEDPQGFPSWFNYTSTVSGSGGSIGSYAETQAVSKFRITGSAIHTIVHKVITNKGSWSGTFYVLRPFAVTAQVIFDTTGVVWAIGAIAPKAYIDANDATYFRFDRLMSTNLFTWTEVATNDIVSINGVILY